MSNQDDETTWSEQVMAGIIRDLWAQELQCPQKWAGIESQSRALPWLQHFDLAIVSILWVVSGCVSLLFNFGLAIPVALVALLYTAERRSALRERKRKLDFLTSDPGEAFPPIAVSKIISEARERSPELKMYLSAVDAGGRHTISAFELRQIVRFLSALDRRSSSQDI